MVQRCNMAFKCWFLVAQPVGGQAVPLAASHRPLLSQCHNNKKGRGRGGRESLYKIQHPSYWLNLGHHHDHYIDNLSWRNIMRGELYSAITTIGSHVASSSSTARWECIFQLGDKVLPTDSFVCTWWNSLKGEAFDSLGKALLLPNDMDHYVGCRDDDLISKLKWHTIAVSIPNSWACLSYLAFTSFKLILIFLSVNYQLVLTFLVTFVASGCSTDPCCGGLVQRDDGRGWQGKSPEAGCRSQLERKNIRVVLGATQSNYSEECLRGGW